MDDHINKAQLLERIKTERAPLKTMLEQLTEEQMIQPGVEGQSSVKDILAHITTITLNTSDQSATGWRNKEPENPPLRFYMPLRLL